MDSMCVNFGPVVSISCVSRTSSSSCDHPRGVTKVFCLGKPGKPLLCGLCTHMGECMWYLASVGTQQAKQT